MNLKLEEVIPFDHADIKVGYQGGYVAVKMPAKAIWWLYKADDLSTPVFDHSFTAVQMSTETPYVVLQDNQGWFVYDCVNHVTY